eukprot:CAMPEP_0184542236 /NCGR_PEP_ID=MMETSP0199_2-20130426/1860_1 /TAXON_ID=1112570 /ORGANISM="Thraustochytrium sp., Strain LLF1b" /LENGTH=460 /DNA_ID=CAMNT_0026936007 /DNA_START=167 /DNA_END=1549 /DNA_ORIENTATION=+
MSDKRKSISRGTQEYDVVIVGGGNSAGYLCKTLAEEGFKGSVAIVSTEPTAPYERPALTKAFLHPPGAKVRARLPGFHTSVGGGGERQTEEWYSEHGMDLMLSSKATTIDLSGSTVTVQHDNSTHRELKFDKLVLATGARAVSPADINMKNASLQNVFTIREEKAALEMVERLEESGTSIKKMVIVGGGYIGLELAAAFVGWGFDVTLVFPGDTLLERLFPELVGRIFENYLTARGISTMSKTRVTGMYASASDKDCVGGVTLSSGEKLPADVVLFGVGGRLNSEVFDELDLKQAAKKIGGLEVDSDFRTSNPNVFAIGDIAALNGGRRYEHVDFCRKSAARCGEVIVSGESQGDFPYLPYFYSRIFEYSDLPVVFQFYGDQDTSKGQAVKFVGDVDAALSCSGSSKLPTSAAVWYKPGPGTVTGVLVINGTPDQYQFAKDSVLEPVHIDDKNFTKNLLA